MERRRDKWKKKEGGGKWHLVGPLAGSIEIYPPHSNKYLPRQVEACT